MLETKTKSKRLSKALVTLGAFILLFMPVYTMSNNSIGVNVAYACPCCCNTGCAPLVRYCGVKVCACQSDKERGKPDDPPTTMGHITKEFKQHRKWIIKILWEAHVLPAMMLMTEQITTLAVHQVLVIGSFFDAKHQLESQRMLAEMQAQAHKEYQPSTGMCQFGTNMRSLAAADRNADFSQLSFAERAVQRQLLSADSIGGADSYGDRLSRLEKIKDTYCNPKDFGNGFDDFCKSGNKQRMNKDVNFTHTVEYLNTLKVDFEKPDATEHEQDLMSLSANLYGHTLQDRLSEDDRTMVRDGKIIDSGAFAYMKARSLAAKRSVAQAAFAAQVALRAQGENKVMPYMTAILEEMDIPEEEIKVILGEERPSYWAQMDILTKRLYQRPNFYANLYDKPVNVDRKTVSMQAIDMMQRRDMYRSMLRTEAITAVLLDSNLKIIEDHYVNESNKARQSNKPLEGLK